MSEPKRNVLADGIGDVLRDAAETGGARHGAASRARLLLLAQMESGHRHPRRTGWRIATASVAVSAAAVAALTWWLMPSALTYRVIGAEKEGVYLSASDERPATVQFSDATTLQVAAGSRLRIESVTARGARVLVERGHADARVTHRDGTRWTFAAGPFDVAVTGTRFDLSWDPTVEVFDLKLLEGSVEIQTPFGTAPVSLHADQEFHADLRSRSMTTSEPRDADAGTATAPGRESPPAPTAEADDDRDATPAAASAVEPSKPRATALAAKPVSNWAALVAAGEFGTVLAEVDERGVETCLRRCSASDLRAVADAARYSGRADLAGKSLRALVSRFARESSGREAAFWLGRLLEQQGDSGAARGWYARYRAQAQDGIYAPEALAGTMRTTLAADGRAAAGSVAREYLARYPSGADAATARSILGTP